VSALLLVVLPSLVAFVGVWLGRRWGSVFAVVSLLLDLRARVCDNVKS